MVDHTDTRPIIDGPQRQHIAKERRKAAAELSGPLTSHVVPSNQEEHLHGFMPVSNFSKGLNHDEYGLVHRENYSQFVKALSALDRDSNGIAHFDVDGPYLHATTDEERSDLRQWESPLAGLYYSLEGPDPAAVAMAPAPALGASELCAEMAEVYAFAILRDMPFADLLKEATKLTYIDKAGTKVPLEFPAGHPKGEGTQATLGDLRDELAKLSFLNPDGAPISSEGGKGLTSHETRRREVRWEKHPDAPETFHYTVNSMFRGSAPGAKAGPHISQFLLLGTKNRSGREGPTAGNIQFGAQHVSQRMEVNKPGLDFMSDWDAWLAVQNAAKPENPAGFFSDQNQFITTPRDLATYVHYDQLYQAYFNACLIMLTNEVEPSKGFPNANKESPRGPFATFGGPHILSLMTEVATRGLKAVRRQKFQIHRRARPEVIAARLTQVQNGHDGKMPKPAKDAIESMLREFGADYVTGEKDDDKPWVLLHWIDQINADREQVNRPDWMAKGNFLLPMAFPEGSPMHPAYGAGHATVAGACVTVLKAFFEMTGPAAELPNVFGFPDKNGVEDAGRGNYTGNGETLSGPAEYAGAQSLEGELNKLAANISIGRNMAGVHYYSDYYDSLRLGERIAAGIIEEQMLNYPEKVTMTFTDFDGDTITIRSSGHPNNLSVSLTGVTKDGAPVNRAEWFDRHVRDHLPPEIGL